jgi:hypothetical protein
MFTIALCLIAAATLGSLSVEKLRNNRKAWV